MLRLSILEQSIVSRGKTAKETVEETVYLAQKAEE